MAFLIGREVTHALTISYNHPASADRARFDLRRLHARLDRLLLGRRFNQRPGTSRTWFAACVENLNSNTHVHLAVRAPEGREADMEALFATTHNPWSLLAPHASHHLQRVHDAEGWAAYCLKEMSSSGDLILSDEFLPASVAAG